MTDGRGGVKRSLFSSPLPASAIWKCMKYRFKLLPYMEVTRGCSRAHLSHHVCVSTARRHRANAEDLVRMPDRTMYEM